MFKKNIAVILTIISISAALILAGCAKSEPAAVVKNDNTNQPVILSNTNSVNPAADMSNNPAQTVNPAAAPTVADVPKVNDAPTEAAPSANKKTAAPAVKEPTPQIGSGANDLLLVIQVRNALRDEKQLFNTLVVDSKEGNVTLSGKAASSDDKAKAGQLAQAVKGVKSVKNNITVSQ